MKTFLVVFTPDAGGEKVVETVKARDIMSAIIQFFAGKNRPHGSTEIAERS